MKEENGGRMGLIEGEMEEGFGVWRRRAWRLRSKLSTESSQHLISHEILPLQLLFLELPHHKDLYIFLAACC